MPTPRPPYAFLVCPDSRLLQERLAAWLQEHGGEGWERHIFWGEEGLGERFWNQLTLENLLGVTRCLVVRHAEKLKTDAWTNLNAALNRVSSQAWPFFCLEGDWDRGAPKLPDSLKTVRGKPPLPCWTTAQARGWIWQSEGLTPKDVTQRLQQWARSQKLTLAPGAAQALQKVLPVNASALEGELEKLLLAAWESGEVTPAMAGLVHDTSDLDLFTFLDMVNRGSQDIALWKKVFESNLAGQSFTFAFLSVAARELRTLWQIKQGDAGHLRDFIRKKKEPMARRLTEEAIAQGLECVLEAERGIKSGERDEAQAFTMCIAGLAQTLAPSRQAQGRGR